jgi:hypothetical protein
MNEDVIFKRRNRLKKHFINVSNVLLYCYEYVSDAAKITFQIIDGFDWESKETGDSKGYVFPAVATIAKIRHVSTRTIQRHILELIKAKLLTRLRQRNKSSILYIEEVSEEEINKYFKYFEDQEKKLSPIEIKKQEYLRNDKNVVSHKARETTKMSFAYIKEYENKEYENNVNKNFNFFKNKKRYSLEGMKDILKRFDTINPTLQKKKNFPKKTKPSKNPEEKVKRDYFATQIATELNDEKSLGCYRVIAEKVPQQIIFETLGSVKETWKDGKIQKSRGALFVDLIKTYCDKKHIDLQFNTP